MSKRKLNIVVACIAALMLTRTVAADPAVMEAAHPAPAALASEGDEPEAPLHRGLGGLALATVLATGLAFRPRRRGTPERSMAVVQTQIILAMVGAVVMIVVGTSLARAFGIVGAAGLVRYRAKVNDPKDAGVMLSTLALGLASGVGLYRFAVVVGVFFLLALWILEALEPEASTRFAFVVKAKDATTLRPRVEDVLRRRRIKFAFRGTAPDELSYEVRVPERSRTDDLSNEVLALGAKGMIEIVWDEKKDKS